MKKIILFITLLTLACSLLAKSLKSEQPPFNIPEGYEVTYVKSESEFDLYKSNTYYDCYENLNTNKSSLCTSKFYGFDDKGYPELEGAIKNYYYKKIGGGEIPRLLIQKNYQKIIEALGGGKHAYSKGENNNVMVYLLEKQGQKIWILIDTTDNTSYSVTTVTSGNYKSILTASKLAEDIAKQGYITLNVSFDNNKSIIKNQDKPILNEVIALLKNDPVLKLSVDGHTDNVGSAAANKLLSQQRSESIVKYLISSGVAADRLLAKGFGSEAPVADNRSEEGKAKNRRVELVKIK